MAQWKLAKEYGTAQATFPPDTAERPVPSPVAVDPAGEQHDDVARDATDRAGEMWQHAKDGARARLDERKDQAAEGVGQFAGVLRDAARNRRPGDEDAVGRLAESAADSLERLSTLLRRKDVSAMLHDVNNYVRDQPVAFFGLALAAGFVAARLMKDLDH